MSRPTVGFYEWQKQNGEPKQPYRVYRENTPTFAIAGLWEVWEGDEQTIPYVTILTTEPNEVMKPIHDRMPVVLASDDEERWLSADPDKREALYNPYSRDDLATYKISTRVNNPSHDDPSVTEPLEHEQLGLGEFAFG